MDAEDVGWMQRMLGWCRGCGSDRAKLVKQSCVKGLGLAKKH